MKEKTSRHIVVKSPKDFEGTILIDTDDVVMPFVQALCEFVNYIDLGNGRKFSHLDINKWDLSKVFGVEVSHVNDILNDFYESDYFLSCRPSDEALDGIELLSADHKLVVVTSRPFHLEKHTSDFYKDFFPGKIQEVRFARHDTISDTQNKPAKNEIGLEYLASLRFAVEDFPIHARGYVSSGIHVLLPDQYWNKAEKHPLITRVGKNGEGHWDDICEIAYRDVLSR